MGGCKGGVVLLHGRLRLSLHGRRPGCSAGLVGQMRQLSDEGWVVLTAFGTHRQQDLRHDGFDNYRFD